MQVNLITGFLGSGKTTMILNLLNYFTGKEKVAVLVNDFGKIGLDGEVVSRETMNVLELPQGCICCSLKTGFEGAISDLINTYHPERILIEPSGIASPSQILTVLQSPKFAEVFQVASVICMVDAKNFFQCCAGLGAFYFDGLKMANHIVINKVDLVDKKECAGVVKLITEINPKAEIFQGEYGRVPLAELAVAENGQLPVAATTVHAPAFASLSYHILKPQPASWKEQLLEAVTEGKFGKVYRIKGIVQLEDQFFQIDYVMGDISIKKTEMTDGKIAIIGQELNQAFVDKFFSDLS